MILRNFAVVGLALAVFGTPASVVAQNAKTQDVGDVFAEGDLLSISVYGRNDLTGKYRVQPSGSVSLPLLGAIDLAGLTARGLEARLAKSWEDRLGAPLSVSIEFAERAPFYILGDVQNPGAYPYRYGMTVLQAVATGGGLRQLADTNAQVRMSLLRERERRAQALDDLAQSIVERERLTAELQGTPQIALPPRLAEIATDERIKDLHARQVQLKTSREEQYQLRKTLLDQRSALGKLEIRAYEDQYNALEKQARVVGEELSRPEKLRESGLGLQPRVFDMQQRESTLSTDKIVALAAITRAKTALANSQNELTQLSTERRNAIEQALVDVDKKIRDAELIERAAAQQIRAAGLSISDQKQNPQFSLQRARDNAGLRPVGPSDPIRPGDVIEVWIPPDDLTGAVTNSNAASLDPAE